MGKCAGMLLSVVLLLLNDAFAFQSRAKEVKRTVVFLEITCGRSQKTGTGFLWYDYHMDGHGIIIVTCRHVIDNCESAKMRVNVLRKDSTLNPSAWWNIPLIDPDTKEPTWVSHPDPNVDIAAMRVMVPLQTLSYDLDQAVNVNSASEPRDSLWEGESIFYYGFPIGMIGSIKNEPILRHGVIASINEIDLRKAILIEAYALPGNSGSPVYAERVEYTARGTAREHSVSLVGMIYAYKSAPQKLYTSDDVEAAVIPQHSSLSYMYPVDEIEKTIEQLGDKAIVFRVKEK